jgi:hypothetical protein
VTAAAAAAAPLPPPPPPPPPQPSPACSLLGLPTGGEDSAAAAFAPSARLRYDGPGPFLPIQLPRLEHTCTPCFPASCVGDRCLQSIFVTYPRPLARAAAAAAASASSSSAEAPAPPPPLLPDPLGAPYPLAVISGGFLLGSDSYASLAARLASWGYVSVLYDRRDGLTDLLDDASCAALLADLVSWCSRDPLLRRLADPSRTLLVGHSRGCKIGALAALRLQDEERREVAEEERGLAAADRCAALPAASAAAVNEAAGNAPAEAEALRSVGGGGGASAPAAAAAAAAAASPASAPPSPPQPLPARKRPRVVGMVCLDPVDSTKYAPESARYPSALGLMRERAAAEAAEAAEEAQQQQQQQQQQQPPPRSAPRIAGIPWAIVGAGSGADCAPVGSNYSAWFEQVPGPALEVVVPGAGHMAFTDGAGGGGGDGVGGGGGGGGGGGSGNLARSVCSAGAADEAEVRRASMALAVAFAEGVVRRGARGGVLAALAEQRCGGVAAPPAASGPGGVGDDDDDDDAEAMLRSTRQAVERTLAHLRATPPGGGGGGGGGGGLRSRWRGFPPSSLLLASAAALAGGDG